MTLRRASAPSLMMARIGAVRALGLGNVARALAYRLQLRAGVHPVQRLTPGAVLRGPFFRAVAVPRTLPAPQAWQKSGNYFGWYQPPLGAGPPDWHSNIFDGQRANHADANWWTIPDFDPARGDIKAIWEASRFDWVVNLAQQGATGMEASLERLNVWLADWCARNPPYRGHNWKCAQEASIRVMHLAIAALVLGETDTPLPDLMELVTAHLRRIEPTVSYAVAQDNNHGTSEAAALFVGGSWLASQGQSDGPRWERLGRALLKNRVRRLIEPDGTFSQYSVVYHRLMLDTLSLVEIWRRHLALPPLEAVFTSRASAASAWLRAVVDPGSGDAPNWGANDGANLLPLTDAPYRDFRPAVQLSSALFENRTAYSVDPWPAHLAWLGVQAGRAEDRPDNSAAIDFADLAVLTIDGARAMFRFPRFRFRPGHADALHVDLWVDGENVLRDGGTFSYATDAKTLEYFAGASGHNTVQFDDHQQMPRLGRFLWGSWLRAETRDAARISESQQVVGASYRDAWGARHARTVELGRGGMTVTDRLDGFASRAVVRWRLRPGDWTLTGGTVRDGRFRLEVTATVPMVRCRVVSGFESRLYMQKTPIPVLEAEVAAAGTVTTRCRWDA